MGLVRVPTATTSFCGAIGRVISAVPHKDLPFMSLREFNQGPRIVAKDFDFPILPNQLGWGSGV